MLKIKHLLLLFAVMVATLTTSMAIAEPTQPKIPTKLLWSYADEPQLPMAEGFYVYYDCSQEVAPIYIDAQRYKLTDPTVRSVAILILMPQPQAVPDSIGCFFALTAYANTTDGHVESKYSNNVKIAPIIVKVPSNVAGLKAE